MKTAQDSSMAFDRMSTHEELHQVLALLNETPHIEAEAPAESDDQRELREAVSSLWQDTDHDGEQASGLSDMYSWAQIVSNESDRIN